ncbi:MAG: hypothetical protein JXR78_09490 [Victivallales bacterium]|nr:hypothetical protein [Victivallales bacterium]
MQHKPLIPMGAITGNPTREELLVNLEMYRKAGIDQFLIYARSGLEVEYMGSEWLEICRHIIEYCAKYNMAVWLYDEYNWPSGKCKGNVIKSNSAFASKKLVAFADRNFCGVENPDATATEYFWTEMSIPLYADLLNPDSVDCFINLTHEVYANCFGKYFGSTIKGIFSDEPSFMYANFQKVNGSAIELPYYDGLKDDYSQLTGRQLLDDLNAHLQGHTPETLWYDFFSLLGQRFNRTYMDKIRNWCDAHKLLFTGHLMSEPHPKSSIFASGRPMDAMRSFSMPGLDEIGSHSIFDHVEWNTFKLLESAMNGTRTEALAELFALGPCDMTLTKMREIIYIAAVHGVNHFVTAVSALNAKGNVEKAFYYNPVAPTQPWFKYAGELNDSAAEAAELTRKPSTVAIALRYPQHLYCQTWHHKHNAQFQIDYTELIKALINAQWEFRLAGDDEVLDESCKVILNLTVNGAEDELSRTTFNRIEDILIFLENNISRRARLCFEDGSPVEQILLKTYDDGTVCVVNTSTEHLRGVSLNGKTFDMPPRDVAIFPRTDKPRPQKVLDLRKMRFNGSTESANTMRCMFPPDKLLKLEVQSPLEIKAVLRTYNGKAQITIDDAPVVAENPCSTLPYGLRQLYSESDALTLTTGIHTLRLCNNAEDLPYLPLLVLAGDFALGQDGILRQLDKNAKSTINTFFNENLKEYTGTACFELNNIDLSEYSGVSFDYQAMPLELFIDGQPAGTRLWPPFEWELPTSQRKAGSKLELKITTSVGPLFGDYPAHTDLEMKEKIKNFWPGGKSL